LESIFNVISYCSVLVAFATGLFFFRRLGFIFRLIFLSVFIGLVTETIGAVLLMSGHRNVELFNIYHIINITLLGIIGTVVYDKGNFRKIVYSLMFLHAAIWIGCIAKYGVAVFANLAFEFASIFLVCIYLFLLIKINLFVDKLSNARSISSFSIAVIIYFGCNIPGFGFMNYLQNHYRKLGSEVFIINCVLSSLYYIIIMYSFYIIPIAERQPEISLTREQ
jgi:hypothetical protein